MATPTSNDRARALCRRWAREGIDLDPACEAEIAFTLNLAEQAVRDRTLNEVEAKIRRCLAGLDGSEGLDPANRAASAAFHQLLSDRITAVVTEMRTNRLPTAPNHTDLAADLAEDGQPLRHHLQVWMEKNSAPDTQPAPDRPDALDVIEATIIPERRSSTANQAEKRLPVDISRADGVAHEKD